MKAVDQPLIKVGGQAVVEGVMMRSPKSFAVAVRRASGEIVLRESPWRSLSDRFRPLRWPFLRGSVVLLESLVNGISALNFSARVAISDEEAGAQDQDSSVKPETGQDSVAPGTAKEPSATGEKNDVLQIQEVSDWVIWGTVIFALGLGVGLFIALPHMAVWLGGLLIGRELGVQDLLFHVIVGGVKLSVFLAYISLISLMKDVRRIFMFHGAEHQSIYTYEAREELTVENARRHTPLHPRCGTTFLIMVIGISILVFSLVFPLLIWAVGEPTGVGWLDQIIYIGIKLPLLFPIAGLAYEFQRLVSKYMDRWWARALAWPGMLVQRITTRPPNDDQLEVALTSLRKTLWREKLGSGGEAVLDSQIDVFDDYQAVVQKLGEHA
jgi:uncharacterized protein YqhQ